MEDMRRYMCSVRLLLNPQLALIVVARSLQLSKAGISTMLGNLTKIFFGNSRYYLNT